jgi:hypothetical protein
MPCLSCHNQMESQWTLVFRLQFVRRLDSHLTLSSLYTPPVLPAWLGSQCFIHLLDRLAKIGRPVAICSYKLFCVNGKDLLY